MKLLKGIWHKIFPVRFVCFLIPGMTVNMLRKDTKSSTTKYDKYFSCRLEQRLKWENKAIFYKYIKLVLNI